MGDADVKVLANARHVVRISMFPMWRQRMVRRRRDDHKRDGGNLNILYIARLMSFPLG